jgi:hypothetical protein
VKRTRIHVGSVVIDGAAGGLDPERLRREIEAQVGRAASAAASPRRASRVPVVRVDAPVNAGPAGIARAVGSALSRSLPSRGSTGE